MGETINGFDKAQRLEQVIDAARAVVANPGNQAVLDGLDNAFNGPLGYDVPGLFTRTSGVAGMSELWAYSGMLGGQPRSQSEVVIGMLPEGIAEEIREQLHTFTITQWNAEITFVP